MRLRSCVAIEVFAVAAIAGAGVLGFRLGTSESMSSARVAAGAKIWDAMFANSQAASGPGHPDATESTRPSRSSLFHGIADELLVESMRSGEIESVRYNRGGSSISFRIDFDNGTRAAFKPRQTNWQSIPRREIAAFRINRLLELSTVPPAIGATVELEKLYGALEAKSRAWAGRMRAEMITDGRRVQGELSWWIPVLKTAQIGDHDLDSAEGIATWSRHLHVGSVMPSEQRDLLAQLSTMLAFDFLINNSDRWSGGNAKASEDGKYLYYIDNTLSFTSDGGGHRKVRSYLEKCQRFSRSFIARLRNLREDQLRAALAFDTEPFERLLSPEEIIATMQRAQHILQYVDSLIERHGEDAVLVFP